MTLKALRDAAGLTQDQLAARSGLSQTAISALENGRVPNPQLDTLEQLGAALGRDLPEIAAAVRASVSEAA